MGRLSEFIIHRWYLILTLVVVSGLLIAGELKRRVLGFKDVKPVDAVRMMNREHAVMLDVREDKEYREGHVLNAVHIPMGLLESRLGELEAHKGQPVVVYCRTGQRAAHAATLLVRQGYPNVHKLGGGILAWQDAGLPVTKR